MTGRQLVKPLSISVLKFSCTKSSEEARLIKGGPNCSRQFSSGWDSRGGIKWIGKNGDK